MAKTFRERMSKRRERLREMAERMALLSPEERVAYIPSPLAPPSEFEVQAYLYGELQRLGYAVRGEVLTRCGTCKFDLVVYVADRPVKILEVKKCRHSPGLDRRSKRKQERERGKQLERYRQFGVPVEAINCLSIARDYIARVIATKTV